MISKTASALFLAILLMCGVTSCYQVHSDDDLRTIPVTNNPNIVPRSSTQGLPSQKI